MDESLRVQSASSVKLLLLIQKITAPNAIRIWENLMSFRIKAPFTPERFIEAIQACVNAGMSVIIIDSISHEWDGTKGRLHCPLLYALLNVLIGEQ